MTHDKDLYANVPHKGGRFLENGKHCHWSFSDTVKVGDVIKRSKHAWRPLCKTPGKMLVGEPRVLPSVGGFPVQQFVLRNPGFYYEIDKHVECVDARSTPEGRIVKWVDLYPISGAAQQGMAWSASSVEEYESFKAQALRRLQNA